MLEMDPIAVISAARAATFRPRTSGVWTVKMAALALASLDKFDSPPGDI